MLIAYEKFNGDESWPHVLAKKTEDGWHIEFRGKSFDFVDGDVDFFPDMAGIFESKTRLFLCWASGNACDKAGFYSSMFRNLGLDTLNFGAFFIDSTGSSHFFTRFPVEADGIEPTIIAHDPTATRSEDAFERTLPTELCFAAWNQRHRAKINSLGHISLNDSLAALEAQVDLQNRIIQKLVAGEDASSDVAILKQATNGVTVDTLHDDAKLVQTISRQKAHIRQVQKDYFNTRGDAQNADVSA